MLNVPNSGGVFYRLASVLARCGWQAPLNRLWQHGLASPHLHYFNERNLVTLVERHGFVRTAVRRLPAVRAKGLWQRLTCARNARGPGLYIQFVGILCAAPLLRLFQSDIIVCVFRRQPAAAAGNARPARRATA